MKTTTEYIRPIDAVVAGYLGLDIAPGFGRFSSELFRPGKLIETNGLYFSLGGVVANTGLAMRRFGMNAAFMGSVGNDLLGNIAIKLFEEAGVNQGIRRTGSAGTAYGIVLAPPGMDRIFLEDPGCNRIFTAENIDYEIVGQSRLFHFGYPPLMDELWKDGGRQLKELLEAVSQKGTAISLDMSQPDAASPAGKADWKSILTEVLPFVDIFAPSIEELVFMLEPQLLSNDADIIDVLPEGVYRKIAGKVLNMGVKILLIKAGHKGAFLITRNLANLNFSSLKLSDKRGCQDGLWLPPLPVESKRFCNASGAGDCAVAGFLSALLRDNDIVTAGKYAMMAGRDNLYGNDAVSGLREWSYMEDSVKKYVMEEDV